MTPQARRRPVRRALLSVSDKSGLVEFARGLHGIGVELIASGGTARALRQADLDVIDVATLTGSPEMLGGRVKTLHPRIHGGLLARRDLAEDVADLEKYDLPTIDLVAVNLYPFEATVAQEGVSLAEAIEKIDIGGPSMIRSAAKNHAHVAVVVDPADYPALLEELGAQSGELLDDTRARLAVKAFQRTGAYDAAIHHYLARAFPPETGPGDEELPTALSIELVRSASLRYGENPHQRAALYGRFLDIAEPLHGKELSYNNLVDTQAALSLILEFDDVTSVAILKHNTPCGVGSGDTPLAAYRRAFATDPESPFGGIIVCSRSFDLDLALEVDKIFTEVLIAPAFSEEALELLRKKKNRRLLCFHPDRVSRTDFDWRRVFGGVLLQEPDLSLESVLEARVVTERKPTDTEVKALQFGWNVVKHVKSNAVVFATANSTLAIGGGATSRVDAILQARAKAERVGIELAGCALASDAFFPFSDGLEAVAEAGATAVIQPGGSVRDAEVIDAANRQNLAMVFTGVRHFRH
ncbi:MAG: bifunctional phosphoribosylaminoimidazolecarboxamide formyltransferase/IMP cyclohydrolase [Myxococcota bacterium]